MRADRQADGSGRQLFVHRGCRASRAGGNPPADPRPATGELREPAEPGFEGFRHSTDGVRALGRRRGRQLDSQDNRSAAGSSARQFTGATHAGLVGARLALAKFFPGLSRPTSARTSGVTSHAPARGGDYPHHLPWRRLPRRSVHLTNEQVTACQHGKESSDAAFEPQQSRTRPGR